MKNFNHPSYDLVKTSVVNQNIPNVAKSFLYEQARSDISKPPMTDVNYEKINYDSQKLVINAALQKVRSIPPSSNKPHELPKYSSAKLRRITPYSRKIVKLSKYEVQGSISNKEVRSTQALWNRWLQGTEFSSTFSNSHDRQKYKLQMKFSLFS